MYYLRMKLVFFVHVYFNFTVISTFGGSSLDLQKLHGGWYVFTMAVKTTALLKTEKLSTIACKVDCDQLPQRRHVGSCIQTDTVNC